jgi:hypothetical protein
MTDIRKGKGDKVRCFNGKDPQFEQNPQPRMHRLNHDTTAGRVPENERNLGRGENEPENGVSPREKER